MGAIFLGPTAAAALAMEFTYASHQNSAWVFLAAYLLTLFIALMTLFHIFPWALWIKITATIPFVALSLLATLYVCLLIAMANGDVP